MFYIPSFIADAPDTHPMTMQFGDSPAFAPRYCQSRRQCPRPAPRLPNHWRWQSQRPSGYYHEGPSYHQGPENESYEQNPFEAFHPWFVSMENPEERRAPKRQPEQTSQRNGCSRRREGRCRNRTESETTSADVNPLANILDHVLNASQRNAPNRDENPLVNILDYVVNKHENGAGENPIINILDQIRQAGNTERDQVTDCGNLVSKILEPILKHLGDERSRRSTEARQPMWKYRVDCSGFKTDNIAVKMSKGSLIVKAVKQERARDGSLSTRSMEKVIPLPRNVVAKKVACKMLHNSFLQIEAPLKREAPKQNKEAKKTEEKVADKKTPEEPAEQKYEMKVLPNGFMIFTSIPETKDDTKKEPKENKDAREEPKETSAEVDVEHMSQQDDVKEKVEEDKATKIPVERVAVEEPQKPATDVETTDNKTLGATVDTEDAEIAVAPVDEEETSAMTVENHDAEASHVVAENHDTADSAPEPKADDTTTESREEYTVELAESDDDAESTCTKDSEESFVLLQQEPEMEVSESAEETARDIKKDEETETTKVHQEEKQEDKKPNNNAGNNVMENIFAQVMPGLQNFIVNQNDGRPLTQAAFEPQNLAKMISETIPKIQDLIVSNAQNQKPQNQEQQTKEDSPAKPQSKPVEPEQISDEEFSVRLEMPICHPESIRVCMDDEKRVLNISAMKGSKGDAEQGHVHKTIEVPQTVDESKVKCQFRDGLLSITAPYKSLGAATTRDIPVNV